MIRVKRRMLCILSIALGSLLFVSTAMPNEKVVVIPMSANKIDLSYFEKFRTAENLEGWDVDGNGAGVAVYSQSNSTASVALDGTSSEERDVWFQKSFPEAKGVVGTINCSQLNGGEAHFGTYLGVLNGYHLQAMIKVQRYSNQFGIKYKLRLKNDSHNIVETLVSSFSSLDSALNEDIKIAFVKKGNSVYIYINGKQLVKWQPSETIGQREWTGIWYGVYVNADPTAKVATTFKNISVIL